MFKFIKQCLCFLFTLHRNEITVKQVHLGKIAYELGEEIGNFYNKNQNLFDYYFASVRVCCTCEKETSDIEHMKKKILKKYKQHIKREEVRERMMEKYKEKYK